ncbi:MAG: Gfo/Idh/MocA family oxidoreductase [Halobacteriota archaeon]
MSRDNRPSSPLDAGVIGVGSMGRNHARVLSETLGVNLVGVTDADDDRAQAVAAEYGTRAMSRSLLLSVADVVVVAVPTEYHADVVRESIEADVHVLVEKPFVDDLEVGRELARLADDRDLTLQVGHIEQFNPVMDVVRDLVPELDVVAIDIDRLGPPLDRETSDNVVMDLMVHDIDILFSLVDADVAGVSAVAHDDQHVAAQFAFDNRAIASVTASRLTQQKVRSLSITAHSRRINVDFIAQNVEIHRRSVPEYITTDGDLQYRHESVVERPTIQNGEPLKRELVSFVEAVTTGAEPQVTATDALRTLEMAERIESLALAPKDSIEVQAE